MPASRRGKSTAMGAARQRTSVPKERWVMDTSSTTMLKWITASDNATARRLYDAHATATPWVTYDMKPSDVPLMV